MRITEERYVIVTRDFPLEFDDGYGYNVDDIRDARKYRKMDDAVQTINDFDEECRERYEVRKVVIVYEF